MLHLLCFLCCVCALWRFLFPRISESEPPELSGKLPFIGHAHKVATNDNYKTIIKISEECLEKGGFLTGLFVTIKGYAITDPESILTISNTCLEKPYPYSFLKPFFGEGLFIGNVSTWQKHRKLLNPAFNQQIVNSFLKTFNNQSRILADRLASQLKKPYDHGSLLKQNVFESICLTATGMSVDKESNTCQDTYSSLVTMAMQCFNERLRKLWLHIDSVFNMSTLKRKQDKISAQFVHFIDLIVQKKKAEMKSTDTDTSRMKPYLELMIDIANKTQCFTDKEVIDETNSIISAGHETTSTALNIILIALGSFPEIQEKVYNEIIQVCGDLNRDLEKDDLSKLVYTEAIVKETLRLYPVAPVIARNIDKDIKLKNYTLKRDTICVLLIYGLNRHPVWGPDANEFKPERWLDTATLPDINSYGSFAVGKRNCIGKAFAMMSMKTALAHVIRRYRVSADISKLVVKWHMTTYVASGHHYTLEQR